MYKTLLVVVVFASACISTSTTQTVSVTDVVDGDTMDISYFNGSTDTVRLIGVDTPEVRGEVSPEEFEGVPDTEAGRECLRNWARNASSYAKELEGTNVTLKQDPVQDLRGSYGRLLAYLHANESPESFNYNLVKNGYARVYDSRFEQKQKFLTAEAEAQSSNIGLWSC